MRAIAPHLPATVPAAGAPRCLLVSLAPATGPARIVRNLHLAGFQVGSLSPAGHFLTQTRYVDHCFTLPRRGSRWLPGAAGSYATHLVEALRQTLDEWSPDLVIPGDETVSDYLRKLTDTPDDVPASLRPAHLEVLTRSLGDPAYYDVATSKGRAQSIACELGIRVPNQIKVESLGDARRFAAEYGYPVVLKYDMSTGGDGTFICEGADELHRTYRRLEAKGLSRRKLKDFARSVVGDVINKWWYPNRGDLQVQQFIQGEPASCCLVAVEGETLASFVTISEAVYPALIGQSAIVRLDDNREMREASARFVAKLGYTGFACLDFVVEPNGGAAYFLECNPRPTPTSHLGSRLGDDLAAALYRRMRPSSVEPATLPSMDKRVLLFPQEMRRNPSNPLLNSDSHDVPWDDPRLVSALMGSGGGGSWAARIGRLLSGGRVQHQWRPDAKLRANWPAQSAKAADPAAISST